VQVHLARQLLATQDFVRSEALIRDSIKLYEDSSSDPQGEAGAEYWLGELLLKQARLAEAEAVLTAAVERSRRAQMVEWRINRCLNSLGEALYRQGRTKQGREMIVESHRQLFTLMPQKEEAKKRATERMQWLRGLERVASRR
jgi:tetratricopeptide (TPR) repeat protein